MILQILWYETNCHYCEICDTCYLLEPVIFATTFFSTFMIDEKRVALLRFNDLRSWGSGAAPVDFENRSKRVKEDAPNDRERALKKGKFLRRKVKFIRVKTWPSRFPLSSKQNRNWLNSTLLIFREVFHPPNKKVNTFALPRRFVKQQVRSSDVFSSCRFMRGLLLRLFFLLMFSENSLFSLPILLSVSSSFSGSFVPKLNGLRVDDFIVEHFVLSTFM